MSVQVPAALPWAKVTVTAFTANEAIELEFPAHVREVALYAEDDGWLLATTGTEGSDVGTAGAPLPAGSWAGFDGLEWDPSPSKGPRLFVQSDAPGQVLHVVAR